jgi:hypothetical protein
VTRTHALALIAGKSIFGATLAAGLMLSPTTHAHVLAVHSYACEEDQACWDCATMGNKICGIGGV